MFECSRDAFTFLPFVSEHFADYVISLSVSAGEKREVIRC